jgi:hypothetical protein
VGIRNRLRKLEEAAQEETVLLRCLECGEELRVQEGLEIDLVAHEWAEEQRRRGRGHEIYGETHPDVYLIASHPHSELSLVDTGTGEPWLKGLIGAPAWEPPDGT